MKKVRLKVTLTMIAVVVESMRQQALRPTVVERRIKLVRPRKRRRRRRPGLRRPSRKGRQVR
jgi:hypothetical protein